jgi:hypothetical protein
MAQGKKTIIDYEMVKKYAMLGLKDAEIALLLGIRSESFCRLKNKDKELVNALKEGQTLAKISVTKALYDAALNGNITACIFFLVNRYPDDWKNVNKIEHSGGMKFEPIRIVPAKYPNSNNDENK